ncbi:recombinase family protein, partial [Frankia sp. Cr1]|uniref:recombinase family protein n=1 Tax=Frankia sp. Cr1 TaxID=3073931 RepID=UPI002AD4F2D1
MICESMSRIARRMYENLSIERQLEQAGVALLAWNEPIKVGGAYRARGAWGKSTVSDLLRNPKYTGYQVFNRRASRSRHGAVNGPEKWVWSDQPVHEPLIPKWMFDEFNAHRQTRRGSREGNDLNTHPAARRTYVFRGMIFCAYGRCMIGYISRPGAPVSYICWPKGNNRGREDKLAGHPKTVRIREDVLLNAVPDFYAERVFGRRRVALLTAELATFDDRAAQERAAARGKLQRRIEDLASKQDNILRQAQDGDPADPFTQGLRRSYNDLDSRRAAALAKVEDLDVADDAEPDRPGPDSLALLDALPKLQLTLGQAPEALQRRLYEITQLAVHVNHENQEVQMVIKIPATDLDQVADLAEAAAMPAPRTASTRGPRRVDAV